MLVYSYYVSPWCKYCVLYTCACLLVQVLGITNYSHWGDSSSMRNCWWSGHSSQVGEPLLFERPIDMRVWDTLHEGRNGMRVRVKA